MIVDRVRWMEHFDGHVVDGVAVADDRRYFFLLLPDEDEETDDGATRVVFADAARALDAKRFVRGAVSFKTAGVVFDPASGSFLTLGLGGDVFAYDGQRATNESALPVGLKASDLRAVVHGLGRVGKTLYAAGWPHRVWRRRGANAWDVMDAGFPPDRLRETDDIVEALHEKRLRAIAGLADDELYAVGDGGEIWQWDGRTWRRRGSPVQSALVAACAAVDRVYLADETGVLWVGRGDEWARATDRPPYPVADMAWFDGRLWCGMTNGALQQLQGRRLVTGGAPAAVSPGIHHIDVAPDGSCLVAAGRWGAARYDGSRWQVLVGGTAPR